MEEKEYEFTFNLDIGLSGECMGKLKGLTELKAKIKKEVKAYLENHDAVASYDFFQIESDMDYEELD